MNIEYTSHAKVEDFQDAGLPVPPGCLIRTNEYHIHCEAGSLGDMLAATSVFKNGRKGSVTITDEPRLRNFASIFDGLCEVKFVPSVKYPMPLKGTGPTTRRLLSALGIDDYATPHVIPRQEDIDWAIDWIATRGIKLPVAVGTNVGGNPREHLRKPSSESMQWIINQLISFGCTPIIFGISENRESFRGVIDVPDLPISKLSAMYYVIKKFIGPDSGDYHLMLAVGGNTYTLIPDNAWNYRYDLHLYTSDCFPPGHCRVRYVNFRDYQKIFNFKNYSEKRKLMPGERITK